MEDIQKIIEKEGNLEFFMYKGMPCFVLRPYSVRGEAKSSFIHLCGYVEVPRGHRLYKKGEQDRAVFEKTQIMGQRRIVSIRELMGDNPTICLSPLRVFDKCFECPTYIQSRRRGKVDRLKCSPHINTELANAQVNEEIMILQEKLHKLNTRLLKE